MAQADVLIRIRMRFSNAAALPRGVSQRVNCTIVVVSVALRVVAVTRKTTVTDRSEA